MNATRTLIAAAALSIAAIGLAQADEADGSQNCLCTQVTSMKSRAEVKAELAQYRQDGANPWSISYDPLAGFQSTTTRAQVTAEYLAHRDQAAAMTSEDSGSVYVAQHHDATPSMVYASLAR